MILAQLGCKMLSYRHLNLLAFQIPTLAVYVLGPLVAYLRGDIVQRGGCSLRESQSSPGLKGVSTHTSCTQLHNTCIRA